MATTIYQLSDPISGEVRYIGKTVKRLPDRLCAHMCSSRYGMRNHLHHWLRSLPVRPIISALVVVENALASDTERAVIALYRANEYRLVNGTDGGDGAPGHPCSEEQKALLSAMMCGRKMPPRSDEWRRRMSASKTGGTLTAEHRAKIGEALKGRAVSEATRAKQRAVKLGKVFSEEHRANLSAAHRGIRPSEETRARMRAAHAKRLTNTHS